MGTISQRYENFNSNECEGRLIRQAGECERNNLDISGNNSTVSAGSGCITITLPDLACVCKLVMYTSIMLVCFGGEHLSESSDCQLLHQSCLNRRIVPDQIARLSNWGWQKNSAILSCGTKKRDGYNTILLNKKVKTTKNLQVHFMNFDA